MKLLFDREADALLLEFRSIEPGGVTTTQHAARDINLLLNSAGEVVAIEVLNLTRLAGRPILDHLEMDIAPSHDPSEFDVELPLEASALIEQIRRTTDVKR